MLAKHGAKAGGAGKTGELGDVMNRIAAMLDNSFSNFDSLLSDVVHHGGSKHLPKDAIEMKTAQSEAFGDLIQAQRQMQISLDIIHDLPAEHLMPGIGGGFDFVGRLRNIRPMAIAKARLFLMYIAPQAAHERQQLRLRALPTARLLQFIKINRSQLRQQGVADLQVMSDGGVLLVALGNHHTHIVIGETKAENAGEEWRYRIALVPIAMHGKRWITNNARCRDMHPGHPRRLSVARFCFHRRRHPDALVAHTLKNETKARHLHRHHVFTRPTEADLRRGAHFVRQQCLLLDVMLDSRKIERRRGQDLHHALVLERRDDVFIERLENLFANLGSEGHELS